jgi:parallel beta-helix repeat protein
MGTVVTIILLFSVSIVFSDNYNLDGIEPSRSPYDTPIRIDSDSDLESQAISNGWPGNGTESNPFIIENYDIDGTDNGCCLYIGNTTKHLKIRNCTFFNSSYHDQYQASQFSSYYGENGINFFNVENGKIENVSSKGNRGYGAFLILKDGYISNSNFSENERTGLRISGNEVLILENDFTNNNENGLFCYDLIDGNISMNSLTGNDEPGLLMYWDCLNNTIHKNQFSGNRGSDIELLGAAHTYISGNDMSLGLNFTKVGSDIITTNILDDTNLLNDGIIRYYRETQPDEIDIDSPQIIFVNISDIEIDDFESTHQISSMVFINCEDVKVTDSRFHDSPKEGLLAVECRNLTVENCSSREKRIGFWLEGSFSQTVTDCESIDNDEEGLNVDVRGLKDEVIVRDNIANGNGGTGITITQASGNSSCMVISNTITNNGEGMRYISTKAGYYEGGFGMDVIRGNEISGNNLSGMRLSLTHSSYLVKILENTISRNGDGLSISDLSGGGTVTEGNLISKNEGDGFSCVLQNNYIEYKGRLISCGIFNNTITGNSGNGTDIVTQSGGGVPIEKNIISDNGNDGILFTKVTNRGSNNIENNTIENNGGIGIEMGKIASGGDNPIKNNTIRFNKGRNSFFGDEGYNQDLTGGIFLMTDSSSGYPICDNLISDNNGTGIRFLTSYSGSGLISGNEISRNNGDGINIFLSSSLNRNIHNNSITENRDSGIELGQGIKYGYRIDGNRISGNSEGIFLNNSNKTEIMNNIIMENEVGILSRGGDNASISMNLLSDNSDHGVKIEYGNHSEIWNNSFFRNNGASSMYDEDHKQACDSGSENRWFNNETGNYWDDWRNASAILIRTDPYPLDCETGSVDPYPLGDPPFGPFESDLFITNPVEGSYLKDSTVIVHFTIHSNGARIDAVEGSLDNGPWMIIEEEGQWTLSDLTEGPHSVKISILEVTGRIVERSVEFHVDLTDPEILNYSPTGDNVMVDSYIEIEFSEELMEYGTEFDFPIIGNVSIEDNTAGYYPSYPMEENTEYSVGVLARDLSGRTVEINWTFTTGGASYRVYGRVVDVDGKRLEGVNVVIFSQKNQSDILNVITTSSGEFETRGGPGSYRIILTKEGYEVVEMEYDITDNFKDLGNIEMEELEDKPDGMNICMTAGVVTMLILALIIFLLLIVVLIRKRNDEETEE